MRSPHSFIIKPKDGKKYDNEEDGIIMSASTEDHEYTNRHAVIVSTPVNYSGPIKEGSVIITHHNTFRLISDMKGREELPSAFIKDDLYFIDEEMIYLYKNPNESWRANYPFCFIKPVDKVPEFLLTTEIYEPLHGEVKYTSNELPEGSRIVFTPHSEYEFNIDGEKLYRMKLNDICLTLSKEF